MSYLNDYLKVIPKADADKIRANILKNQAYFEVNQMTETAFHSLILQLAEMEEPETNVPDLGTKITADPLNAFYSNVLLDLSHLFAEQNQIERAGENYDSIYQAHLEEMKKEVEALRRRITELEELRRGEDGLVLRSYSFEPEIQNQQLEIRNDDTAYLFCDRDGTLLEEANIDRLYHTYFLSLGKTKEIDALKNEKGLTTATLEVLYESPYTLANQNEMYGIEKVIDGDSNTFWFNVALKPNNALDSVSISQKGRD